MSGTDIAYGRSPALVGDSSPRGGGGVGGTYPPTLPLCAARYWHRVCCSVLTWYRATRLLRAVQY
eukprot:3936798-Rhodomonas_salina.2